MFPFTTRCGVGDTRPLLWPETKSWSLLVPRADTSLERVTQTPRGAQPCSPPGSPSQAYCGRCHPSSSFSQARRSDAHCGTQRQAHAVAPGRQGLKNGLGAVVYEAEPPQHQPQGTDGGGPRLSVPQTLRLPACP